MSNWPVESSSGGEASGLSVSGANLQYTITADATENTRGAWVELVSATAREASGFWVDIGFTSAAGAYLLTVGIGASGYEVDLLTIPLQTSGSDPVYTCVWFPIAVPAGARIAACVQSNVASATVGMGVEVVYASTLHPSAHQRATTYGISVSTSQATLGTGATAADTPGPWVEVAASTTFPIRQLYVCVSSNGDTTFGSYNSVGADVSVGASGSEVLVVQHAWIGGDVSLDVTVPCVRGPYPVDIPAGSRVAVRWTPAISSTAGNWAAEARVAVIGVG